MDDVQLDACPVREFHQFEHSTRLRQRRARLVVRFWIYLVRLFVFIDHIYDNLVVFRVEGCPQACLFDQLHRLEDLWIGNAREAIGIRLEGRHFKGNGSCFCKRHDLFGTACFGDRSPQADVDNGFFLELLYLFFKDFYIGNGIRQVVGHV